MNFYIEDSETITIPNTAPSHNGIYRGRNLSYYTIQELSDKIKINDLSDLYIGDYIEIELSLNDKKETYQWRIAAFDWFYDYSISHCNTHHIVLFSDTPLFDEQMNKTDTTAGGFQGTYMWKNVLPKITTALQESIGEHLLQYKTLITANLNETKCNQTQAETNIGGASSDWEWVDCYLNLFSESQVCGTAIRSSSYYDVGGAFGQLPIFRLNHSIINNCHTGWWLSSITNMKSFANISWNGRLNDGRSSHSLGVRPFFLFY